jgi:nucleotide-binding universal stress UspA family protein
MAEIIVPFDFSSTSVAALDQALLIAQNCDLEIEVLHITNEDVAEDYPEAWECTPGDKVRLLEKINGTIAQRRAFLKVPDAVQVTTLVKESSVISGGINKRAMVSNAILLIMGTHGMSGFKQFVLGSNTSAMINNALYPVMAIPPHWQAQMLHYGLVTAELKEVNVLAERIRQWSRFLHLKTNVVQFTPVPDLHSDVKDKKIIGGIAVSLELSDLSDTLAESVYKYTKDLQETVLIMFVHERKRFEKIFDFSKTERAARIVEIPLLAIPKEQ